MDRLCHQMVIRSKSTQQHNHSNSIACALFQNIPYTGKENVLPKVNECLKITNRQFTITIRQGDDKCCLLLVHLGLMHSINFDFLKFRI